MWITVQSGGPEDLWMTAEEMVAWVVKEQMRRGLTFWTMEIIVVGDRTLTAVFLTQTGGEALKKRLSQPKVSMHSSVSDTDAADDRNKRNLPQTRWKIIFSLPGRVGWRWLTPGWIDRWSRASSQIRVEGKRNNISKLCELQKIHPNMAEGHGSSQANWLRQRCSWQQGRLWWDGTPGSMLLQGLVSSQYGSVSQQVWSWIIAAVAAQGAECRPRERGGHNRWEQRLFPHQGWSTVTTAWLLSRLLWPVVKIPDGGVMHVGVINNSDTT